MAAYTCSVMQPNGNSFGVMSSWRPFTMLHSPIQEWRQQFKSNIRKANLFLWYICISYLSIFANTQIFASDIFGQKCCLHPWMAWQRYSRRHISRKLIRSDNCTLFITANSEFPTNRVFLGAKYCCVGIRSILDKMLKQSRYKDWFVRDINCSKLVAVNWVNCPS